jgi:hypothetical protein
MPQWPKRAWRIAGLGMLLLSVSACSTLSQAPTVKEWQEILQQVNGAGCLAGHVVGAGIGAVRLAATWGPDLSDEAQRYCFPNH